MGLYMGDYKFRDNFILNFEETKPVFKTYPSEPITADSKNFFSKYDGEMEQFLAYDGDVAYLGSYGNSYIVLDKNEDTMLNNTHIWIKFKEPVKAKTFSIKIGSTEWGLYATNDETMFRNSILYNRVNSNYGTPLIDSGLADTSGMIDYPINDEGIAYKYYMFGYMYNFSDIYEIALKTE